MNSHTRSSQLTIRIPNYVANIAKKLKDNGFKAYLVGGPVRDTLLNKIPHDYDLATDATPNQIKSIFPKTLDVGEKFGTVIVVTKTNHGYIQTEITTFRIEDKYISNRKPKDVSFITDIHQDLSRRDFTINAMALDLTVCKNLTIRNLKDNIDTNATFPENFITITTQIIDDFNGIKDLNSKIIRAVGNPDDRLKEDALRILRGCRFASQLNFTIEKNTLKAMQKHSYLIQNISKERIRDELTKILLTSTPSIGINYLLKTGALKYVIPELLDTIGVKQRIGHAHDVYNHLLAATDKAPRDLIIRLAALLHDISKPECDSHDGHFYGHDVKGAKKAEEILRRLKFPKNVIRKVTTIIRWHMFYYPGYSENRDYSKPFWTDSAVRRFLRRVGLENIDALFKLRIADATSNPKSLWDPTEIDKLKQHINKVLSEDSALKIKDLKINGHILMQELKIKPGPTIGKILNYLLEKVLDDPSLNTQKQLIQLAKDYIKRDGLLA